MQCGGVLGMYCNCRAPSRLDSSTFSIFILVPKMLVRNVETETKGLMA